MMLKNKRIISVVFLSCVVLVFGSYAENIQQKTEDERAKALELLDKYAQGQPKLESFVLKSRSTTTINGYMRGGRHKANNEVFNRVHELHFDGERISFQVHRWYGDSSVTGPIPKDKCNYMSELWDGKYFSSYARGDYSGKAEGEPGTVTIRKEVEDNFKRDAIAIGYTSNVILGIFYGDYERIDSVIRQADKITVRDKTERIGDSDCYVIEAVVGKCGKYAIWIDPEHGYNIAQAKISMGEKPVVYGKSAWKLKSVRLSLKNVRFKKVSGIWFPEQAESELDRKWFNEDFANEKYNHKLIELILNPDHDALGSFVRDDIKDGAHVDFWGIAGDWGEYKWSSKENWAVNDDGSRAGTEEPLVIVGKALPNLNQVGLREIGPEQTKDKMILVCFWDYKHKDSLRCVLRLKKRAKELGRKGIAIVSVHSDSASLEKVNELKRKFPFPVGRVCRPASEVRRPWGVGPLPWLVLTDRKHIVTAKGFDLEELDEKISISEK